MDQHNFNVRLPEHLAGGVLADFAAVSRAPQYFTLDFAVFAGGDYSADSPGYSAGYSADGSGGPVAGPAVGPLPGRAACAQVVARVKILPAQAIEIMKALGAQLDAWEHETS